MKFFDAEIVYMNFASKEMGLVIYTGLLLFSYGFIYFYKDKIYILKTIVYLIYKPLWCSG